MAPLNFSGPDYLTDIFVLGYYQMTIPLIEGKRCSGIHTQINMSLSTSNLVVDAHHSQRSIIGRHNKRGTHFNGAGFAV